MNKKHHWPLNIDFTLIEGVFNFISFLRNHELVIAHAEAPEVLDHIQEVFEKNASPCSGCKLIS